MTEKTILVLNQTTAAQNFDFPLPIYNVISITFDLMSMVGVTANPATTVFALTLDEITHANSQRSFFINDYRSLVWTQPNPLPLYSDQLSPIKFGFTRGSLIKTLQMRLISNGVLTFAGASSVLWRITIEHGPQTQFRFEQQ